ncbi:MAG: nitronate monooxygenase family protein [Thermodesulfobacteriota bacterium]|nr:nitronate monooxygenase family protein [Thermodesulfobacteriota bacterium]
MFKTRLTQLLGIQYPIIQGGLQWLATAQLASAVSEAGGLGIISSLSFPDQESLKTEIRRMKEMTKKPFGVNLSMLPELTTGDRTEEILQILINERVPVVETSGRSPEPFIQKLKEVGIKLIHKVPSVRFAKRAEKIGADAVTIVGFECGGHPGMDDVTSLVLIPIAARSLRIPIIAGGGIADARGFLSALALGAEGVLMGTRFVATQECPADLKVKQRFIQAKETDTMIIQRSILNAARVIRNKAAEETLSMEERGASLEELMTLISGQMSKQAYQEGDIEGAIIPCGQCVGLVDEIKSVKEVIEEIIQEAQSILEKLNSMRGQ